MAYRVHWLVPKRVIYTVFDGDISKQELETYIGEMRDLIAQGTAPVYHVSNSLAMGKVGVSFNALSQLARSMSTFISIAGNIDINKPGGLNTFLATAAGQVVKTKTFTVQTFDQAIDLLKRIDGSLDSIEWILPENSSFVSGPTTL